MIRSPAGLCASLALSLCILCTSCSTKYQDLLEDRDAQIHELNTRLAEARAGVSDAERNAQEAKDALARERTRTPSDAAGKTGVAAAGASELDGLRKDLPETEVRYSRGRVSIGIDNAITFDPGSETLKPGGEKLLRKVADAVKTRFPGKRIYIEGHTDTDPIRKTKNKYEDNVDLSLERAKSVRTYLLKHCGISERAVAVVGYGEHDPRESGKGDATKAHNRRVEIVVGESY